MSYRSTFETEYPESASGLPWRRYKRDDRKAWLDRWPNLKRNKSRGWRRHVRRCKAA